MYDKSQPTLENKMGQLNLGGNMQWGQQMGGQNPYMGMGGMGGQNPYMGGMGGMGGQNPYMGMGGMGGQNPYYMGGMGGMGGQNPYMGGTSGQNPTWSFPTQTKIETKPMKSQVSSSVKISNNNNDVNLLYI